MAPEDHEEDDSDGEESMLREHKTLLADKEADLSGMDTDKMLTQLVHEGVFAQDDCEIVRSHLLPTKREKNGKIIHLVKQRGPEAFDKFFQSLDAIDVALGERLQPVKHRILWFASSPKHAAAVAYCLEKYAGTVLSRTRSKNRSKTSYILQRGRIFKRDLSKRSIQDNPDVIPLARDTLLYLACPISERGESPSKALREVFEDHGKTMDIAVMSGVCVGVRGDSETQLGVRGGEVVVAIDAVTVDGYQRQLPLSSALSEAKTHLSQLIEKETPPKWLTEAKERLIELSNREPARLVPHFDTIRHRVETTPTATHLPNALAEDTDTFPFYELCTQHLGIERPWFSCKSAISYSMLNNMDPSQEGSCSVVSSLFCMEAVQVIVEKRRQSQS